MQFELLSDSHQTVKCSKVLVTVVFLEVVYVLRLYFQCYLDQVTVSFEIHINLQLEAHHSALNLFESNFGSI